jgi:hypothetical protein
MNKLSLIITVLVLLAVSACEKFLDRQPYDYIGASDFYNSTADIEGAVIGCYNSLHEIINSGQFFLTENRSDNAKYDPTRGAGSKPDERSFSILSVMPTNTYITDYWAACYQSIARCNLVLANIEVVVDVDLRNRFSAEAKFIRSLVFFNLVRLFDGVPLITEPITGTEAANTGRATVDEVYGQIIQDLEDAVLGLSPEYVPEYGAAGHWAAKALLAKVLLTRGDISPATDLLEDIVENSGYSLHNSYPELFSDASELSQDEIIFTVRFTSGGLGLGSSLATYFAPKGYLASQSQNHNWPTGDLEELYKTASDSATDTRYSATIGIWDRTGEYFCKKFTPDEVPVQDDDGTDFPIIRYADILLMLAEVKGQEEGLQYLNQVRNRALTFPVTADMIGPGLLFENYQEAVLTERRLELAFEDHRFFDLRRMGNQYATDKLYDFYTSINDPEYTNDPDNPKWPELSSNPDLFNDMRTILGKGYIEEFRLVLPIPQNDILRGIMEQNYGY